jgi:hypothetical protein
MNTNSIKTAECLLLTSRSLLFGVQDHVHVSPRQQVLLLVHAELVHEVVCDLYSLVLVLVVGQDNLQLDELSEAVNEVAVHAGLANHEKAAGLGHLK